MWKSFRISERDRERLEEMAEQRGMTTSDLMRDMIRQGYQHHALVSILDGIRKQHSQEIVQLREEFKSLQKGGVGGSQDLTEIRRIVTLMALAMPAVAKHV
jgi:predicted DNA-binding protein